MKKPDKPTGGPIPRHELKFYINAAGRELLRANLKCVLRPDPNGGPAGEYAVRSLYFDDLYDRGYYDKLDGMADREKYRVRIYDLSDGRIYLERKRKMGGLIEKSSVRIDRALLHRILSGSPEGLERSGEPLLQDLFGAMRLRLLRPAVIVDYMREARLHPAQRTRVTFDTRVRSGMYRYDLFDPRLPLIPVLDEDRPILEVKYDAFLPEHIAALIRPVPKDACAISKYVLCRRYQAMRE